MVASGSQRSQVGLKDTERHEFTEFFQPEVGSDHRGLPPEGQGRIRDPESTWWRAAIQGKIYPVNHKAEEIEGLKCYPDLASIGETPDLVIVIVPAQFVPAVMEECAKVGVKSVIIITAGFKEVGPEGKKLEEEVIADRPAGRHPVHRSQLPGRHRLRRTSSTPASAATCRSPGAIGYISQSGALLAAILDMANANGIGFSSLVSIGNKADVDELDLIKALGAQQDTKVIAGYLENITDGDAFVREAEEISYTQADPADEVRQHGGRGQGRLVAHGQSGRRRRGLRVRVQAGRRHSLRLDQGAVRFRPGVRQPAAARRAERGGASPTPAGPASWRPTPSSSEGLTFAKLSEETMKKLAEKLPAAANVHNPVDVLGDALADRYEFALDVVLDDPNVDSAVVLLTPQAMTQCEGDRRGGREDRQEEERQARSGLLPRRRQGGRRASRSCGRAASRSTTRRRAPWRRSR